MFSLKKLTRLLCIQTMIKKIQSIDSIETNAYGTKKYLVSDK